MFEIIGLIILRVFGFGWLWGRKCSVSMNEVMGSGSNLLLVGVLGTFFIPIILISGYLSVIHYLIDNDMVQKLCEKGMSAQIDSSGHKPCNVGGSK